MKKMIVMLVCLALMLGACTPALPAVTGSGQSETPRAQTPGPPLTDTPAATPSPTPGPEVPDVSATPAPEPSPTPAPTPRMYSSYADLVTFKKATGIASFDYFDMLKGEDAVNWLVKNEGLSQADAQAIVDDYADSEYIKKNTSSQLRRFDLNTVPVFMITDAAGAYTENLTPYRISLEDFAAMYAANPTLLKEGFFYYIEVDSNGSPSAIKQVYWP